MKSLKNILFITAIAMVHLNGMAQYTHPTVGIQGEFVGACLVADCGPSTYTDNGGFGNYSSGINQIYRTFCPSIAGNCMTVTFNSFNVESGWDFLLVKNGPTQNSPDILTPPNSPTVYGGITGLHGNLATPFSFTSSDPSGCLTFRFYSDGSVTAPGWSAILSCTPCAGGPTGTENNDCITLTPICSSSNITSNATGPGIVAEGCSGSTCPAGGENHTNWYSFTAQTSGTLDILINPDDNTDDYDYAIYGPNVTCNALGNPIRCSDAAVTGNTGLTNVTPNQTSEDVNGDGFTETMNVIAGETYFLVVDEWSPNAGSGYTLSFGGTASLDCTILPVDLSEFTANYEPSFHAVDLHWITESERDCDYFEIERSTDGINYEVIDKVDGAGTTQNQTQYFLADPNPEIGVNYYRLNQWDSNGENHYSDVVSVNILDEAYDILSLFPNPTTGLTEIIFNSYKKGEVLLEVLGLDGKVIVRTPVSTKPGANRYQLDLSNHTEGVYLVSVNTGERTYHSKLIKN